MLRDDRVSIMLYIPLYLHIPTSSTAQGGGGSFRLPNILVACRASPTYPKLRWAMALNTLSSIRQNRQTSWWKMFRCKTLYYLILSFHLLHTEQYSHGNGCATSQRLHVKTQRLLPSKAETRSSFHLWFVTSSVPRPISKTTDIYQ